MALKNLNIPLLQTEVPIEGGTSKPKKTDDGPFATGYTKENLMFFITNPNNIPVLIMAAFTLLSAGGLVYYEATHLFMKLSFCVVAAGLAVIGSGGGTFIVYKSVHLADQVEEFRQENSRMAASNKEFSEENAAYVTENEKYSKMRDSLQGSVDKLQSISDEINAQLEGMNELREGLQRYANKMGADFQAALKETNSIYDKVGKVVEDNQKTLLLKTLEDLEFMDHAEGLDAVEYDRFTKRIPVSYRDSFTKMNLTFPGLAKGSKTIPYETMKGVIDRIVQGN